MLFLTATDAREKNWTKCVPMDGSLFVVGDPKQSIYRFRRADIVTYEQVKGIIARCGTVVPLRANFRTVPPVLDWVNEIFDTAFPEQADEYSPSRCSMLPGRTDGIDGELAGVRVLRIPEEHTRKDDIAGYEPDLVARIIHSWITSKTTIPRTRQELEDGLSAEACPGDFLIISRAKARLAYYAQALERLGIPARVTGGSALGQVPEIGLLHRCLSCISEPDNPVKLVAVLRSELFGFRDTALYEYKRAGGNFSYHAQLPDTLPAEIREPFKTAFGRLGQYESWARTLPLVPALERISADLGLPARTAACQGNMQAGSLAKALEILRSERSRFHSLVDAADYLGRLVAGAGEWSTAEAVPQDGSAVQIMNLHKAKGLEAPVVFLADPTGEGKHPTELHIDRTSGRALGYMVVMGGRNEPLAYSPNWEHSKEIEELFERAEEVRLRYVAATRAGSMLIISRREKNNHSNPWRAFEDHLQNQPALGDPGLTEAVPVTAHIAAGSDPEAARITASNRLAASCRPTYSLIAAKKIAVIGTLTPSEGEHGTEWGTVIHSLLQTALLRPEADLKTVAYDALREQDPELVTLADLVVETVESVMHSEIWQRARASKECLVEVPFETLLAVEETEASSVPRILRGVIDLAFWEDAGWVIVDYKTDRKDVSELESLVGHYKDQVLLYADTWRRIVNQPIREVGLYFTHMDRYVAVPVSVRGGTLSRKRQDTATGD
jgi:ATP-dependent helicase/nuclease subunit A